MNNKDGKKGEKFKGCDVNIFIYKRIMCLGKMKIIWENNKKYKNKILF